MFQRILFPFDGTPRCLNSAGFVADLAGRLQAHLTVLHVIRGKAYSGTEIEEMKNRLGNVLAPPTVFPVQFRVAEGRVAARIVEHAQTDRTDLIVLPIKHRRRWPRPFRLSTLRRVVNDSPCAVWAIPAPAARVPNVSSVLCAAKNGRHSQNTVDAAARIATLLGAPLKLVYAIPEIDISTLARMALDPPLLSEAEAKAHLRVLAQNAGMQAMLTTGQGAVADVVNRAVQDTGAGLLVLGRSASGAASHTIRLLRRVKRPVLIVPQLAPDERSGVRRASNGKQGVDQVWCDEVDPLVRLGPGEGSVRGR